MCLRRLLLVLGFGWGMLVFQVIFRISYTVAIVAALPLLIGAFVANTEIGWCGFVRWICVALLALQAMILFEFVWLSPVVFMPFLGAYLLLPGRPLSRQQWLNRVILGIIVLGVSTFYQSTKYICYPQQRIISDKEHLELLINRKLKSGKVKLHDWDKTAESYLATHQTCCYVSSNAFWNSINFSADVVVGMTYEMSEEEKASGGYGNDTHYRYQGHFDSCGRELDSTGESFTPKPT
jgi:hypothetical protein